MDANDAVVHIAVAVLNGCLALLVARARPRTTATRLVTLLLALTAASALAYTLASLTLNVDAIRALIRVDSFVSAASLVPLALVPLVFPWRRVSDRAVRLVGIPLAVVLLLLDLRGLLASYFPTYVPVQTPFLLDLSGALFWGIFYAIPVFGTLVLLDARLSAVDAATRRQASVVLAAYFLKAFTLSANLYRGGTWSAFVGGFPFPTPMMDLVSRVAGIAIPVACLAVPVALVAARWRIRRSGELREGLADDALVLAAIPVGAIVVFGLGFATLEFLLVRPLLFSVAILEFGLLEVDARRGSPALALGGFAAVGAVFVATSWSLGGKGWPEEARIGVGLMTAFTAGAALAWPVARHAIAVRGGHESRRLVVYRAALAAAAREDRAAGALDSLRALREELGVSDREHAALLSTLLDEEAHARVAIGSLFLGRYRIARALGRGGFGEVWLARDERLGRDVALKRLAGDRARDALALERFAKEMRLASAIQHPNVVAVHDMEVVGGEAWLVMEYVPGGSVADRLAKGPMREDESLAIARDVLDALSALHARGILHRDVKPANVLVGARGEGKLADFTAAREVVSGETVGFTGSSEPVGTIAFMAPEQARGLPATEASDVYSVAATLVAMLTGEPPIPVSGLGEFDARMRVLESEPFIPANASPRVRAALARALAKDPASRFASARDFADALAAR